MEWTFLILVAVLWLVSPIILLIALIIARRQVQVLRDRLVSQPEREAPPSVPISMPVVAGVVGGGSRYAPIDLENLLLLRLELQRLLDAGDLTEDRHRQLIGELDRLWEWHLRNGGAQPATEVWQRRRALAWGLLAQGVENPLGPPPWMPAATKPAAPSVPVRVPPAIVSDNQQPVRPFPSPIPPAPPIPGIDPETAAHVAPRPAVKPTPPPPRLISETVVVDAADWRPAPPSPMERALRTLSGWPKLIAPFLAQNVGWFVGGFCFIAGALFLIANTSGFVNALVVFVSLFGASAFLIWAGYQFRRQRAELIVASNMLLTLGMLLAPLVLTVAVRLVVAGRGDVVVPAPIECLAVAVGGGRAGAGNETEIPGARRWSGVGLEGGLLVDDRQQYRQRHAPPLAGGVGVGEPILVLLEDGAGIVDIARWRGRARSQQQTTEYAEHNEASTPDNPFPRR